MQLLQLLGLLLAHAALAKDLLDFVDPERIKQNLRDFTQEPHVAGTPANMRVAQKIADKWKEYGLEEVQFNSYDVLLSYPNYSDPNRISVLSKTGEEVFRSAGVSPVIIPAEQGAPGAGVQWLAYAGAGRVQGDPVYCHYGRREDFERLKQLGISLKGRVALIRYGKVFRANKVVFAEQAGAIGAVLFSDPAEAAELGIEKEHVYPRTDYMPPEGVQRGTLKLGDGDPLTPLYPSKRDFHARVTIDQLQDNFQLPKIPVLPISYSDALQVLKRMGGDKVPAEWQGGIKTDYRLGPGLRDGALLRLDVHSSLEKREVRNVIGVLRGVTDPDRYVMLGNHFDAWVYGSLDPNSGTAILAEVVRALTAAYRAGVWRPHRSVVFCNWDAEEYGLVGSNEFVEEFAHLLQQRAVVMLNIDLICGNGTLKVDAVPTIFEAVVEAARKVESPLQSERDAGRNTLYDTWYHHAPGNLSDFPDFPALGVPGGGSDHATFLAYLGVPAADITYRRLRADGRPDDSYPLYHTLYETPFTNEHLFDNQNFAVHAATAKYWMQLTRQFAEPALVPINASLFAHYFLDRYVRSLKHDLDEMTVRFKELKPVVAQQTLLIRDAKEFVQRADAFQREVRGVGRVPLWNLKSRSVNDRLMGMERCFVGPVGIPGSPAKRNVLFSTSASNSYAGKLMPGVYDQLDALERAKDQKGRDVAVDMLLEQISHVQHAVQCAAASLTEFIL